eukprot:jgi/Botrbrau1/14281/Bobra.0368s0012.2
MPGAGPQGLRVYAQQGTRFESACWSERHGGFCSVVPRLYSRNCGCCTSANGRSQCHSQKLLETLEQGGPDMPTSSGWVTLMALGLLVHLRDPRSPFRPYLALLPSPKGSRIAHICSHGTPATDLLLFSPLQLAELQNAPLAVAVIQEERRLAALHASLIRCQGQEPMISKESFMWAHVLIRSRALELNFDYSVPLRTAEAAPVPASTLAAQSTALAGPQPSTPSSCDAVQGSTATEPQPTASAAVTTSDIRTSAETICNAHGTARGPPIAVQSSTCGQAPSPAAASAVRSAACNGPRPTMEGSAEAVQSGTTTELLPNVAAALQAAQSSDGTEPALAVPSCTASRLPNQETVMNAGMHGLFQARCLLPLIDLCNHSWPPSFSLSVRCTSDGRPRMVQLQAIQDMEPGQEATLDYGRRPLRDILRGYAFVPHGASRCCPFEVYEDVMSDRKALVVTGSPAGDCFRLVEVCILEEAGDYPFLETSTANVVYIVGDEVISRRAGDAPTVTFIPCRRADPPVGTAAGDQGGFKGTCPLRRFEQATSAHGSAHQSGACDPLCHDGGDCRESGSGSFENCERGAEDEVGGGPAVGTLGGTEDGQAKWVLKHMVPQHEHAAVMSVVGDCQKWLSQSRTSVASDASTLEGIESQLDAAVTAKKGAPVSLGSAPWSALMNKCLAVRYRLERKLLLQRVIEGLELQASLVAPYL